MTEEVKQDLHAIIYTDGSAIANPGPIGYGIHGYVFEMSDLPVLFEGYIFTTTGYLKPKKKDPDGPDDENDEGDEVFTEEERVDLSETPLAKLYKFAKPIRVIDAVGSDSSHSTNNRAELTAALEALKYLEKDRLKSLHIYCDSEYLRNGITDWVKNWIRNNWVTNNGKPVSNSDIWKELVEVTQRYKEQGTDLKFIHIPAHAGNKGNEEADELSRVGSSYAISGETVFKMLDIPFKDLKKLTPERPELTFHPNFYFENNPSYNREGVYFMCDPGVIDSMVGKRSPETSFSIVNLFTPDPYMEFIVGTQQQMKVPFDHIYMTKMADAYTKRVYRLIKEFGSHYLSRARDNSGEVETVCRMRLTNRMTPTGLAFRAIQYFNDLNEVYTSLYPTEDNTEVSGEYKVHDVTDFFFAITEKKVGKELVSKFALKPDFKQSLQSFKLTIAESYADTDEVKNVELPMVFGMDIIPRNTLKKLEKYQPSVKVVTWREKGQSNILRYATVVETTLGRALVCNFFSNSLFLGK